MVMFTLVFFVLYSLAMHYLPVLVPVTGYAREILESIARHTDIFITVLFTLLASNDHKAAAKVEETVKELKVTPVADAVNHIPIGLW